MSYKKEVIEDLYKLGFKKAYVKYLVNRFSDQVWNSYDKDAHLSVSHVIDDLVETIDTDFDTVLQNMRVQFRNKYTKATNDIRNHYSTWHLVQIIIEYANGVFDQISTNIFLYNPTIVNEWFRNENQVLCYNAAREEDVFKATRSLNLESSKQLFYHATNWQNTAGILEYGPDHTTGRLCMDFGNRRSFYVTPDINTAIEWTTRDIFKFEGAIVVFALNMTGLKNKRMFPSPNDQWKKLVKDSRMCRYKRNELDFIYGPMLKNTKNIRDPKEQSEAHSPVRWQLASKKEESDEVLKSAMVGAIFIKKKKQFEIKVEI